MSDKAIIEAAARALRELRVPEEKYAAVFILDIITPLIEAAALERAASMVDEYTRRYPDSFVSVQLAAEIRALKEQP